ncbi:acetylornithine deacetylase [Brackiella oedipodis]|uniref:acetylornithine deacetylase n=1 Tax=Brackiella oedipodis TaxID=124225 RepID=UPI00048EE316|nr:acetylornithine deacetylase [Brackiella oedipodis]
MSQREWLKKLVGFDTTSRNSNLALIAEVQNYLDSFGIKHWLSKNPEGNKANLFATLPAHDGHTEGGVILSGHTDVVPVDNQDWHSDPFVLTEKDGLLYGRGTCDMKGYLATALSLVPEFLAHKRHKPLHFAFSYDEEVGCMGAPVMLKELQNRQLHFDGCVVGEPSSMKVVVAHKGINLYRCDVHGHAAHSSLTPHGCNAIEYAARLICFIRQMADQFKAKGPFDKFFDVPFTSMTTNLIDGGIASNIIPEACSFQYEFRNLPVAPVSEIQSKIEQFIDNELLPDMRQEYPEAQIVLEKLGGAPFLDAAEKAAITQLARGLLNDKDTTKVAYGTEAGQFQEIGVPTIVCGPGSIQQAHKPDEFVSIEQLQLCDDFLRRLSQRLCD